MSNVRPIVDADKIAAAMMASDALGLAGSSALSGFCRVTLAKELVMRIAAAKATLTKLHDKITRTGGDLSPADDARWGEAEAEEGNCRDALKELISKQLGVCADDLWSAL